VLSVRETLKFFAVSEEQRLKVFENRLLRKMIVFKVDVQASEWRKVHNEELLGLFTNLMILG
jgi:hypothetical protein